VVVGKFLLGMVSGGLLVTGGLVVASALFPMQAANDNPPAVVEEQIAAPDPAMTDAEAAEPEPVVAPDVVPDAAEAAVETQTAEEPVATPAAPEDTAAEASTAADTTAEPAANEEATPEEPADVVKAPTSEAAPEPASEATPEPTPVEAAAADPAPETAPAAQPEVDPSSTALEAPKAEVAEAAEPVAPTVAEVPPPETLSEPSKPAEAIADAAAETPAAPEETTVAAAEPEPALAAPAPADPEATLDPAPVAEAEPVVVAEAEPVPAEALAEPGSDTATTEAATAEAAVEPAAEDPTPPAEVAAETVPDTAPAPAEEIVTAEATPAAELPAPELPAAETPAAEVPAAEAPVVEAMPAEPAPAEVAEAPAMVPAPETAEVAPAAENAMPGTRPDALPGTPVEAGEADAEPDKKSPTFKPAPGLPRAGEGVIIDRDAEAEPASDDPAAVAVDTRPIVRFAAAFENSEAKPPLAIVLVDDGSADLDRAALAALPFPVSFALDPLDPASAQHAATYRAAGKEVVMLVTGIAEGAIPADVEVAFQSMEQGLPEAVAVMDLPEPSFQNRRPLAATVVPILKAQGRGLLTWDAGLNAADQVARREDLEAAVIFRDIGATGTDSAAIRRLLDRAVFKAGQDGRASVAGKADAATVAALLEWSVEGKAATVALAPVTAVLTVE
jgi:hypothetical protein